MQHMNVASKIIKLTRTCAGECAWVVASLLVALLFVSVFVLLAESVHASGLEARLATPVNLLRLVVLTAAVWVWAYIARTIRGVGASTRPQSREPRVRRENPQMGTHLQQH